MEFNPSKCNVIRIASSKYMPVLQTSYKLHDQTLKVTASSKYLGVTISQDLSWQDHIQALASKGNRSLGFLWHNFRECTTSVKAATYTTMVRPVIEFAFTVWDPTCESETAELEKVQRRAARYVFNSYTDRTPGFVTRMRNTLKWEPLADQRTQSRLTMLYKINSGIVDIDTSPYYSRGDERTRGSQRLFQQRITYPLLLNSFFPRTMRQWNKLPSRLTDAPSLEVFKAGLSLSTGPAAL